MLSALEHLDLRMNKLSSLPDEVCELSNLTSLLLGSNNLKVRCAQHRFVLADGQKTLPQDLHRLKQLRHLSVRNNLLPTLPITLGGMLSLRVLDCSVNELVSFPSLSGLEHLEHLNVADNMLQDIEDLLGEHNRHLTILNLSQNHLTELPLCLSQVTSPTYLDVSFNQLKEISQRFPSGWGKLRSLLAGDNSISRLPANIHELSSLQELHLPANRIRQLPESFGKLGKLQELSLNNNRLAALPPCLFGMSELQSLSVSGNDEITEFPDQMGDMSGLRQLEWCSTSIQQLPASIGELTKLQSLNLENNQLVVLPRAITRLHSLLVSLL